MTKNENLLVTLMEECAELQQAVSKALRFGMDNHHPSAPGETNEMNIMTEYYQLVAVMDMLVVSGVLRDGVPASQIKNRKRENVERYQQMSAELGLITPDDDEEPRNVVRVTSGTIIGVLDRMKAENGDQVVILETPEGTSSLHLKDATIYEGYCGEIVLDSE